MLMQGPSLNDPCADTCLLFDVMDFPTHSLEENMAFSTTVRGNIFKILRYAD